MVRGIGIGDLVAVTATVRRRVDDDTVSVSIPSYDFPHSIRDSSKVKRGLQLELTGEVTRIDEDSVTIALGPLVTVSIDKVRLVEKYRPPTRKKRVRDTVD
ncbi:hypothetical protein [Mesorhizobium kowhaii]|uniref:Uncharacterized protein n=1 Tax=Mesorhizobium kowhaii TaxID=1300272 RepID=A0A2W7C9G3_9HYPH|nr:hypothetical protein [Mesorhizobium kowhaii]PZV33363.1 hypothetical protein B5V02_39275 [Mesorhizobium kowhaii]